jgi:hypothetical protein
MDHIGIDAHKRESQIYILAKGVRSLNSGSAPGAGPLTRSALSQQGTRRDGLLSPAIGLSRE